MINIKYILTRRYQLKRKISPHSHDFHEFVYYVQGGGETKIDNKKYLFDTDYCAFIPKGVVHSESHYKYSTVFIIGFETDEADEVEMFFGSANPVISSLVQDMQRENKQRKAYYERMEALYVSELLTLLLRQQVKQVSPKTNPRIDKAVAYIDNYYYTNINLSELAFDAGYCSDRFRNIFKEQVGVTPKQYILNKRISHAKKLLIETEDQLESICYSVGFNYYSRFSTFFKEETGLSPSDYRNKYTGGKLDI